jgi:hypothetical protein
MDKPAFLLSVIVNGSSVAKTLIDSGNLSYGLISEKFAQRNNLPRIKITPRVIETVDAVMDSTIQEVAYMGIDVGGYYQKRVFFYIAPRIQGYDLILGLPWMEKENAVLDAKAESLTFRDYNLSIPQEKDWGRFNHVMVSASAFAQITRGKLRKRVEVFTASLLDINKALQPRKYTNAKDKLPLWIPERLHALFDRKEADKLPHRRPGIDHKITLEGPDGKPVEAPWGPLYNMSREELLVLRKTLTELLSKGFIRVSNSPAAAPVLFVKKPGGGLRFCCDYRALNRITRKDRYPLPLIQETLNRISKAKWFTKLDVVAAFYKIRIEEGDEWKTAFRTRFGLFEWLVTPFGLANAPSTFQRYINWVLQEYLDEFVSAYIDDILIFTEGSKEEHRKQVNQVLEKLNQAGLQIDIDKCEFETRSTKYLGFIIEAGEGLRMDPVKIEAIEKWESPSSAKETLSFLGFANFYRRFIRDFSKVALPMYALTKKNVEFRWNPEAEASFQKLKHAFITAPILLQFDADRETVVETDSSGYCNGGVMLQYDKDGVLRPCAYFSRKCSPAESNYEIYDKEMLAIINALQEWDAELRSVARFTIVTDHKALEYFTTVRKLSERQMRWSLVLSRFNFTITYRPGKQNVLADALSRRAQDMPKTSEDTRVQHREMQLIKPEQVERGLTHATLLPVRAVTTRSQNKKMDEATPQIPKGTVPSTSRNNQAGPVNHSSNPPDPQTGLPPDAQLGKEKSLSSQIEEL